MNVLQKKEMKNIKKLVKAILAKKTDKERAGFNLLYKECKKEGYSDERFYAEMIEHFKGAMK